MIMGVLGGQRSVQGHSDSRMSPSSVMTGYVQLQLAGTRLSIFLPATNCESVERKKKNEKRANPIWAELKYLGNLEMPAFQNGGRIR